PPSPATRHPSPATLHLSPIYEFHFAVRDTGIGIPPDRTDRLFKSFSQVDASTTRRYGGTGLGLVISQRLSEIMGGRMWVESPVLFPPPMQEKIGGPGTTFHFTIQARLATDTAETSTAETPPILAGKRLLIVDDNPTIRDILRQQVQTWGMQSQEVASPAQVLDLIRRDKPFDLILLDLQMPEQDGLALAGEIRRIEAARQSKIPLVIMVPLGWHDTTRQDEFQTADFAAALHKPLKPSALLDILVSIFEDRPGRQVSLRSRRSTHSFDTTMGQKLPLQILVAEDNATNQKLTLQMLKRLGYQADVAGNGLEALDALARQRYDVVLMDMQMPDMDGLEATRQIRQRWPTAPGPHIIAVTANALPQERQACLAAGANDFVGKPIRLEALAAALQKCRPVEDRPEAEEQSLQEASPRSRERLKLQSDAAGLEKAGSQEKSILDVGEKSKTETVLDPKAIANLNTLVEGQSAFLVALIDSFLKDAPQLLLQMRQALTQENPADLKRAAHTLKSVANNFGAAGLAKLCKELESLGRSGTLTGGIERINQVEMVYEQVRLALEAIRREYNE
ncbi:MAG: response regulator, partial [Chloroflexi bacterium]|nr:response regulator [Chloroflexota bacterium]